MRTKISKMADGSHLKITAILKINKLPKAYFRNGSTYLNKSSYYNTDCHFNNLKSERNLETEQ